MRFVLQHCRPRGAAEEVELQAFPLVYGERLSRAEVPHSTWLQLVLEYVAVRYVAPKQPTFPSKHH